MTIWKTKPGVNFEGAAVIRLANQERLIPLLAMRQNRVIVPLMLKVLPIVEAAGARQDPVTKEMILPSPEVALRMFDADTVEIMSTIVACALTRGYEITHDEFLDEAISVHELAMAMPAIVKQTAFFRVAEEGRAKASGEGQATS